MNQDSVLKELNRLSKEELAKDRNEELEIARLFSEAD